MDKWLPVIVQIIMVFVTASGGWYLLKSQRGKINAETRDTTVETMQKLTEELWTALDRAREQITSLEVQVGVLRQGAEALITEAKALRTENGVLQEEARKLRAEVATLQELRAAERENIIKMTTELASVQRRILKLSKGVTLLTEQIRKLGHEPAWVEDVS